MWHNSWYSSSSHSHCCSPTPSTSLATRVDSCCSRAAVPRFARSPSQRSTSHRSSRQPHSATASESSDKRTRLRLCVQDYLDEEGDDVHIVDGQIVFGLDAIAIRVDVVDHALSLNDVAGQSEDPCLQISSRHDDRPSAAPSSISAFVSAGRGWLERPVPRLPSTGGRRDRCRTPSGWKTQIC